MAVAVSRRPRHAANILHPLLPLLGSPGGMSFDPPQLPPAYGAPGAVAPSPFILENEAVSGAQASGLHSPTASQSNKKTRRPSKGKVPGEIKRSASTPHMRNLAAAESGSLSPTTADKRRNKLGYHRTSVACGHCRKRKIRCLIQENDPEGRCQNCIRLKKECQFYAVDQNPPDQPPTGSGKPKPSSSIPSASTPSSPRTTTAAFSEQDSKYQGLSLDTSASQFGFLKETDGEPIDPHHVSLQSSSLAYPSAGTTQWPNVGYMSHTGLPGESPGAGGYAYGSLQTNSSPAFDGQSPLPGGQIHRNFTNPASLQYGGALQDDADWTPPTRSISLGNIHSVPQYPQQIPIQPTHTYPGAAPSYTFPPALDTNAASLSGPTSAGPLSAPVAGASSQNFGYSATPGFYNFQGTGGNDTGQNQGHVFPSQWPMYTEPTTLGRLDEEQPQPAPTQYTDYYGANPS